MSKYDLTNKLAERLDRHMVLPLLQFLSEQRVYKEADLRAARLQLVQSTSMVDTAIDEYKAVHGVQQAPKAMLERKKAVIQRLKDAQKETQRIVAVVEDEALVQRLQNEDAYHLASLAQRHKISAEDVSQLYRFAKLKFDCGLYGDSAKFLHHVRLLAPDDDMKFHALWGKLASEILMLNWGAALEDVYALQDAIDQRGFATPLEQLRHRTWLVHWSLFVFFNVEGGLDKLVHFCFQDTIINTIRTNSPYLLRYVAAAVLLNGRKSHLKDLVDAMRAEEDEFDDPLADFMINLHFKFDFQGAHAQVPEVAKLLEADFFLRDHREAIIKESRTLIFTTYCKIHRVIALGELASVLDLDEQKDEKEIVQLIRDARMDAKIDSSTNSLVIGAHFPPIYRQVIDRVESIGSRTSDLSDLVDRKLLAKETQDDDASSTDTAPAVSFNNYNNNNNKNYNNRNNNRRYNNSNNRNNRRGRRY
eukprot:TRINITY_DN66043_c7_g1_i1.p1 TRINITY_DN66043_c7_g1~~TRINITY_DN66043_c7_g1_i1.p1  ORF type:complete len:485 (-),score=302.22 TRINITY_DN66043_c7_g1_i1:1588-3012(-)